MFAIHTLLFLFASVSAASSGAVGDETKEDVEFWSRTLMASMPIGGEPTTWFQTPGCRKAVFYGANLNVVAVVAQTEDKPGIKHATFDLRSHPTDGVIIGTGQSQLQEFVAGTSVGNFGGAYLTAGSYLFNGEGRFGQGEIFWSDFRQDVLGTVNPSDAFEGDSGFAITGGHGDFKCATGWLDLNVVEPKKLAFNDNGEWNQNIDGLIWRVEMFTCGICKNIA